MRNIFQKYLIIIVVAALVMAPFVTFVRPVFAIHKFWVEINDHTPGAVNGFKFHFSIEKLLQVHQYIKIVFPPGTTYTIPADRSPLIPEDPNNPCKACQGIPIIKDLPDGSVELKFNTHIELDPSKEGYRDIVVSIPSDSAYQFKTPTIPGSYIYKIATQAEQKLISSYPVDVFQSSITQPDLDIESSKSDEIAGFSFDFKISSFGRLDPKSEDKIKIRFPKEFIFTKSAGEIHDDWITVNENNISWFPDIEHNNNDLIITVPQEIKRGRSVSIKIDCRCGIKNPSLPGVYHILVSTSRDTEWISSSGVEIK